MRPIDPRGAEVALVARRMRETLVEVLGEEEGARLYSMTWLEERVRFHLDPARSTAAVFVAEDAVGRVTGHTIVRVERDTDGATVGLFSTTFVAPGSRRAGIATRLLERGEAWMTALGLATAVTYTAATNAKLIALYEKRGYARSDAPRAMVRLERALVDGPRPPPSG